MDKLQEFYDMLAPIQKQISANMENITALYCEIEEDLSIGDEDYAVIESIHDALFGILCMCGKGRV